MKKKLLMLILTGVLSGAMLAGCGNEPTEQPPSSENEIVLDEDDDFEYDDYQDDEDIQPAGIEIDSRALLDGIVGEWECLDDPANQMYLTITSSGSGYYFDLEDMSILGSLSGTVDITAEEHPDGTFSFWYTFYDESNVWESFAADVDDPAPTDLYSGQDGAMHFVRSYGSASDVEGRGDVSPYYFLGIWGVDDGSYWMQITDEGDGSYHVHIQSMIVDNIGYIWEYYTYFDDDSEFLFCDDGEMWECEMVDPTQENQYLVYDDGSVNFYFVDGGICWGDHNDPSHQSVVFEFSSDN